MKASDIIDVLLSEFKTDKAGLAAILTVNKSTISNISKGYTKKISSKLAQKIIAVNPSLNYEFLLGNSDETHITVNHKNNTQEVSIHTLGRSTIGLEEIAHFVLNNIEEFEKNEIFKIYKTSIINQTKVEVLQEQLLLKNSIKDNTTE